jgi:hypothetical protein
VSTEYDFVVGSELTSYQGLEPTSWKEAVLPLMILDVALCFGYVVYHEFVNCC